MPAFYEHRDIEWNCYVEKTDPKQSRYDLIIGRDLMHEVGIDLLFSEAVIKWDTATIKMSSPNKLDEANINTFEQEIMYMKDPETTEAERIQTILDAKYCPADLNKIVETCTELNHQQQQQLLTLLKKYESIFDGTLGTWKTEPINLELKDPEGKPYHSKPYSVPYSQEQKLKDEVERMCTDGILRKINHSEWAFPAFTIPKPDGTLRSLANLIELNKRIKRKPFPLPKISELLQKLEGFMYATSLDLNMGYYHINLTPSASKLCTVVFPWGKYEYLRLPMGLCNSPDIFQEKISDLMSGLEFTQAYLDDLLIISKKRI
jgi:regulator of RNase E activity RraB